MASSSSRLGEILVERKVLSRDDVAELLSRESSEGVAFAKILIAEQWVNEADLIASIAHQHGFGFFDFSHDQPNPAFRDMIPAPLAHRYTSLAVEMDDSELVVAMADPSNRAALEELRQATGFPVRPVAASPVELRRAIVLAVGEPEGGTEVDLGAETADLDLPRPQLPGSPMAGPEAGEPGGQLHVNDLLAKLVELGGSDLHLTSAIQPCIRVDGHLRPLPDYPVLNGSETRRLIFGILTQRQREKFEETLELDTSHAVPGVGRFRVNVFLQRDSVGAVMRAIPYEVVPFKQLGLPEAVEGLARLPRGLVLVTGPTGSGKSTTLASLVDIINSTRGVHIMTVEDPIEFLHSHKMAVINQREVGEDTTSFAQALKHVLRQDPDVILVGEMRDLDTISTALTAAETGHLVFATLHTQDAPQSVDRVIDVFPSHQQQQVRVQLASALQGIVTQQLLPTAMGRGRVVASEVLIATPAVRNLIREGKTHQIYSAMQAGGKYGMQTMDMSLAHLIKQGAITLDAARERCANPEDLKCLVSSV